MYLYMITTLCYVINITYFKIKFLFSAEIRFVCWTLFSNLVMMMMIIGCRPLVYNVGARKTCIYDLNRASINNMDMLPAIPGTDFEDRTRIRNLAIPITLCNITWNNVVFMLCMLSVLHIHLCPIVSVVTNIDRLLFQKIYQCSHCSRPFKCRHHLVDHENVVHYGIRKLVCTICGSRFAKRYNLNRHIHSTHPTYYNQDVSL